MSVISLKAPLTTILSSDDVTAAKSSNRGVDVFFSGATLDYAVRSRTITTVRVSTRI